jgi:short-subunit dehydrogenase
MDLHLRGKRVLITGASKGIGAAAAEAFAEEGAHLLLAARSGEALKALADRLRSAHQIDAATSIVDLRKEEDVARLAKEAADIDVLVNNAGDIPGGSIDKIDLGIESVRLHQPDAAHLCADEGEGWRRHRQ